MSLTEHIMSCTKKGCTRCEPPVVEEDKEVSKDEDSYRIRVGYKRIRR